MSIGRKIFTPQLVEIETPEADLDSMLQQVSTNHLKEGSVVKGQLVKKTKDFLLIDVGLKNESMIPVSEFIAIEQTMSFKHSSAEQDAKTGNYRETVESLKEGDVIDIYVEKVESINGTVLSRIKAIREMIWQELENFYEERRCIYGVIDRKIKGGFVVSLNGGVLEAFLPGSQVDVRAIDVDALIGTEHKFHLIKISKANGNVVVSRREVIENLRAKERDKMLETLKEGAIIKGIVKNIIDYGAFIDLKSMDGLLHITDISWKRINHPSEVLTVGQEIEVMVTKFDNDKKIPRISLGMKQLTDNPWTNITKQFPENSVHKGKITDIRDYGIFVELKPGVEGLVYSAEISWGRNNTNAQKSYSIGQEVNFVILSIDEEKRRISLSMKQCSTNPLAEYAKAHAVGSVIKAPIRNITNFAIFVTVFGNTDGMIHMSDISWNDHNHADLLSKYKPGEVIDCKILEIDVKKEKIALGIKQLHDDPNNEFANYKKYDTITCKVTEIQKDGIDVIIDDKISGFIRRSDLSIERTDQSPYRFAVDDRVDAKIINIDKKLGKVFLSVKALEKDKKEKILKKYGSTNSGASLGAILGAAIESAESNDKDKQ